MKCKKCKREGIALSPKGICPKCEGFAFDIKPVNKTIIMEDGIELTIHNEIKDNQ